MSTILVFLLFVKHLQESRRIAEVERLDLTGKSHSWNSRVFHTYSGINVTSSTDPYGIWDYDHYRWTYPLANMFRAATPNVNSIFASAVAEGQLVFDLPTKVYVEYLRIYPYCSSGHNRYGVSCDVTRNQVL